MTTVFEKFSIRYSCWRDQGPCSAFHYSHIHTSLGKEFFGNPKCNGGADGYDAPGSPEVLAFRDELYKRFPLLHAPGGGDGISNCRNIAGSSSWSDHAYRTAIDVSTDGDVIGYLTKVYDWITGPWEEEEEDVNATQDTMLRRDWYYRAGKADALGIKRPESPEKDDGVNSKGWSDQVAQEEIKLLKAAAKTP